MSRLVVIAVAVGFMTVAGLLVALQTAHASLKAVRDDLAIARTEIQTAKDNAGAADRAVIVAEEPKERVREVIRTLPPVRLPANCRDDPAVLQHYRNIERMRDAARGNRPAPGNSAPPRDPVP